MSMGLVPPISLRLTDYRRLQELAALAGRDQHPVADFLATEVRRARVESDVSAGVVCLGRCITYTVDGGPPVTRMLVHPQDYSGPKSDVSVLSPVGAALIGLRVRDRMPFIGLEGFHHEVAVLAVAGAATVVDLTLARRRRTYHGGGGFDPDPGAA